MPVTALRAVSRAQNGVGAFILQCKRIDFHYCDRGGSSEGMNSFLKQDLAKFARQNPSIEIVVSPRPNKHPVLRGYYVNGRERAICAKNLHKDEIMQKADLLKTSTGERVARVNKPVKSLNESVRGIWDPYHGGAVGVRDILGLPK